MSNEKEKKENIFGTKHLQKKHDDSNWKKEIITK